MVFRFAVQPLPQPGKNSPKRDGPFLIYRAPFLPASGCVAIKKRDCHARESKNPVAILFKISSPWMLAFVGMTNYHTVS
jgi:hypothetical protein